ncbi:uncharacterized protein F5891DRAFT_993764 [Suillus fuscotomentosus]|uniref:Uncharacterized protein n=1 Tax=Suillus fuscotomentosus TaxID=1912939 RepID=A0AAD4EM18_9AGAM|nr:uncharacterized protein F5891DRAFT_993764 [Suillus fuscotomentosus]KAG1908551.1 hypothetical protein F5891DRAFT_993764 [Suillus fuscotomentosus]
MGWLSAADHTMSEKERFCNLLYMLLLQRLLTMQFCYAKPTETGSKPLARNSDLKKEDILEVPLATEFHEVQRPGA